MNRTSETTEIEAGRRQEVEATSQKPAPGRGCQRLVCGVASSWCCLLVMISAVFARTSVH